MRSESMSWWKSKYNPAEVVTNVLTQMATNSMDRLRDYRIGARLYGATDMWGPYTTAMATTTPIPMADSGRLRLNVTQACADTLISKIGKNKPRPMPLTSGGDFKQQRATAKLAAFLDGAFSELRAYELGKIVFRDGLVMGDGVGHARMDGEQLVYERVPAWELFVDDFATISNAPRQIHRVQMIERDVLMARFPEKKAAIEGASAGMVVFPAVTSTNLTDMVEFHESWHLPSGKGAGDGMYLASVDSVVLEQKEWTHPWFPFARFRWCQRTAGFWSQGLAEQLKPIQLDINREAALLQKAHYRQVTFDWWVPNTAKVASDKISNDVGSLARYQGTTPPFSSAPPPAAAERYRYLWTLYEKAFEIAGVSQMSASSVVPAGLESGKAIRAYSAVGTDRFASAVQAYDEFFLELSEITIGLVEAHVKATKKRYPIRAPSWSGFDQIDFKDIDIERGDYMLTVFPTASLPNEPAGRVQSIEDMEARGIITPQTALRLYDYPDVQSESNLITAPENYGRKVFSDMLDGTYTPPEPFDDLKLLLGMALQHYNLWRLRDIEEGPLDLLRRFIIEVKTMTPPPPVATPMPMPGMPPSMTGAPMPGMPPGPMAIAPPMPPPMPVPFPNAPAA